MYLIKKQSQTKNNSCTLFRVERTVSGLTAASNIAETKTATEAKKYTLRLYKYNCSYVFLHYLVTLKHELHEKLDFKVFNERFFIFAYG